MRSGAPRDLVGCPRRLEVCWPCEGVLQPEKKVGMVLAEIEAMCTHPEPLHNLIELDSKPLNLALIRIFLQGALDAPLPRSPFV